jgi:hypothetical protein
MTKQRAYRIIWLIGGSVFSVAIALAILGIFINATLYPILLATLVTFPIWLGLPLGIVSDNTNLSDPRRDRIREEHELLDTALKALKTELLKTLQDHDEHEYTHEYALSVWRSLRASDRTHLDWWWDR